MTHRPPAPSPLHGPAERADLLAVGDKGEETADNVAWRVEERRSVGGGGIEGGGWRGGSYAPRLMRKAAPVSEIICG